MNLPSFLSRNKSNPVDPEIDAVLLEMKKVGPAHADYPELIKHLKELNVMKAQAARPRISLDTVLVVAGNLLGILIIVAYEEKHTLTSKGFAERIPLRLPNKSQ
jgi:hypothetical protein